jgi:hypothetical protein
MAVLGLFLAAGTGLAQETYAIKIKHAGVGEPELVEREMNSTETAKEIDSNGNVKNEKTEKTVLRFVYRQTILEQPDPANRPTRLKRSYEKAEKTVNGKPETFSFQGKTVLIEKGDAGTYRFRIEGGGEVTGEGAAELNREFNRGRKDRFRFQDFIVPDKPVQVKESWGLDMKVMAKRVEDDGPFDLDPSQSKGSASLERVYQKDGLQFGIFDMRLDGALTTPPKLAGQFKVKPGSKIVMTGKVDRCIDGKGSHEVLTGEFTIGLTLAMTEPNQTTSVVSVIAKANFRESRQPVSGK